MSSIIRVKTPPQVAICKNECSVHLYSCPCIMHPSLVTMPLNTRCDKQGFWTGKVQIYNKFYSIHCSRGVTTNFFKASSSKTNMAIIHNQNFLTESCTYFVCVFLFPFSPNILTFAYRTIEYINILKK